jgi:hypothetical protein
VEFVLLLILSLFPRDEWSNRLCIKGKRAVPPSDAEKSRLGRPPSSDVQILLKHVLSSYVPLQFPYTIASGGKSILEIS